ncbi:hypothetical protein CAPTEDRAFT_203323, partial [Capitella teleta]
MYVHDLNTRCKIFGGLFLVLTSSLAFIYYQKWSQLYSLLCVPAVSSAPSVLSVSSVPSVPSVSTRKHWITFQEVGGIGNDLFNFAISMQFAKTHDMDFVIARNLKMLTAFDINNITTYTSINEMPENYTVIRERNYFDCKYDASFSDRFVGLTSKGAVIFGYFQSWKYFTDIQSHLRGSLNFKPHVEATASEFIRGEVTKHTNLDDGQYILI